MVPTLVSPPVPPYAHGRCRRLRTLPEGSVAPPGAPGPAPVARAGPPGSATRALRPGRDARAPGASDERGRGSRDRLPHAPRPVAHTRFELDGARRGRVARVDG